MKPCTHCGVSKPLDDFSPHGLTKDGRQSWCKECQRAYRNRRRAEANDPVNERERANARARGRAFLVLARNHPEEFEALLDRERVVEGLAIQRWERSA